MLVKCEKIDTRDGFAQASFGEFYHGEILHTMPELTAQYGGTVKLLYLDPPFMTGHEFEASAPVGEKGFFGARDWCVRIPAYSDKWDGRQAYLQFMKEVLEGCRGLLRDDGIMAVHVDRHASAYIRILLDEVFGEKHFINEIIWHYHSGGSGRNAFPAKHDTIFLFGKTASAKVDPKAAGKMRTDQRHNHMKKNVDEDGRVYFSIKSNGKEYRYYEDDVAVYDDVWDIPHLQQKHPERTGFGTQKPLELLERLVLSCSQPGDLVCDLFAGSGTTLMAAAGNERRFLGLDQSVFSLLCFRRRALEIRGLDLLIHYRREDEDMAGIKLHKNEQNGRTQIQIEAFQPLDVSSLLPPSADGREYLTFLSVGRIENGIFITEDYSLRSAKKPTLQYTFSVPAGENKMIYYADCLGNYRFIEL